MGYNSCDCCPYQKLKTLPLEVPEEQRNGLVIVGSFPGNPDLLADKAFADPPSKLLFNTLKKVGLPINFPIYRTHAILCGPPPFTANLDNLAQACSSRLFEQIKIANPKVVFVLGNTALRAFKGNQHERITKWMGRAEKIQINGKEIIFVYGALPTAVLANPHEYHYFVASCKYVVQLLAGADIKDPGQTRFSLINTRDKYQHALAAIAKAPLVGADIETGSLRPRSGDVITLGIAFEKNKVAIFPEETLPHLKDLWAKTATKFCWHNGKFDSAFLQHLGLPTRVDHDTLLAHYALCEIKGTHGLDILSQWILGAEDYSAALKPYLPNEDTSYREIPLPVLYEYLAKDCDYTLQLATPLISAVEADEGLSRLYYELLLPASDTVQKIENYGIYTNHRYITNYANECADALTNIHNRIVAAIENIWNVEEYMHATKTKKAPKYFNIGSSQQLGWLLYAKLKLKPKKGLKKSCEADSIASLKGQHFIIDDIIKWKKLSKLLSTFIKGIEKKVEEDHRIHSSYLIHGTVNGRLSSNKPNMQNIPRNDRIKSIFQAPKGRVLIELDYKSAELYSLAHLSQDPDLIQIFKEGRDLHDEMAIYIFGPNFTQEQRQKFIKPINFGIVYGRTAYSMCLEFDELNQINIQKWEHMIAAWNKRFPVAAVYIKQCRDAVTKGIVLTTVMGRKRRFGLTTATVLNEQQNEAVNFMCASLASDFNLYAANKSIKTLEQNWRTWIINLVHDSQLLEADDNIEKIKASVAHASYWMIESPKLVADVKCLEFQVDAKIGYSWGNCIKYKDWLKDPTLLKRQDFEMAD